MIQFEHPRKFFRVRDTGAAKRTMLDAWRAHLPRYVGAQFFYRAPELAQKQGNRVGVLQRSRVVRVAFTGAGLLHRAGQFSEFEISAHAACEAARKLKHRRLTMRSAPRAASE